MARESDFCIVIPTRKRLTALIDCLQSIKRCKPGAVVFVQDNTPDEALALEHIDRYFSNFLDIRLETNDNILDMSSNWDRGIARAMDNGFNTIALLPDRRIMTKNLLHIIRLMNRRDYDYIAFEHQLNWIGSSHAHFPKQYDYSMKRVCRKSLYSCFMHGLSIPIMPMLLNVVITSSFLSRIKDMFGSYVGGAIPDFNFMARLCYIDAVGCAFDIPGYATNSRHATKSNGSLFSKKSIGNKGLGAHVSDPKYYPVELPGFITTHVLHEFIEIGKQSDLEKDLSLLSLFRRCMSELDCPMPFETFAELKQVLSSFIQTAISSGDLASVCTLIADRSWAGPFQSQPIFDNDLALPPNLELLSNIEI